MRIRIPAAAGALAATLVLGLAGPAAAQSGDTRVSIGSPSSPFSANKQNEPAVAVDPAHPDVLAAGANDNIDMEGCNAGPDTDCPFTPNVGVSGIYFSTDRGANWTQPTYTGLTARQCRDLPPGSSTDTCTAQTGPIGTLPNYAEHGLVSDGDPALAWGPAFRNGKPSYANGSRLYYANLTSLTSGSSAFKGFEAIAVSHLDSGDLARAMAGDNSAWSDPVIASRQNSALFADKEQVWADNAESSRFFGNVYVCYAAFQGAGKGGGAQPLMVLTSTNGGQSWTERQVTSAANNPKSGQGFGRSGCTVRTDSTGKVYVFVYQFAFDPSQAAPGTIQMITSNDGGKTWSRPTGLFTAYDTCNYVEPSIGRCVTDGVAGARSDLSPVPSVDIANGAPSGRDATNRIVMTWVDGRVLNDEKVQFTTSTNGGATWITPVDVRSRAGDRGYYSAPAISPDGKHVWLVYNAFTTPFREFATDDNPLMAPADRQLVGVVLHANAGSTAFTEVHRGASGDARGSSQNDLAAEFLGDYVYAAATRSYGAAVWNDVRGAQHCDAVDEYRQELHDEAVATGQQTAEAEEPRGEAARERGNAAEDAEAAAVRPQPQNECPATFGNSDIFGGGYANP